MGIVKVSNIKVYAYHGCLVEEGKIGSDYRVDLEVKADLSISAKTDRLKDTVDYVLLNRICLLYTSPSPRDVEESRMPSSA